MNRTTDRECCQHVWRPYDEPVKDDAFERCDLCQVIHTTRKAWFNQCKAAVHGRAYYDYPESWNITNGIPMNRHYTEIHMPWFRRLGIDSPHGSRRILCVGAGIGQFVPQWLAWGWAVTCLELDQWAATFLENAYPPATVVCDDFMRWEPLSPFDALVSTHNLEHFRETDRAFERMVSMLAPGGKLYVEVPDQSDLYIRGHLWHFTGETLRLWANALGLEDVQVDVRYPSSRPNLDYHLTAVWPG